VQVLDQAAVERGDALTSCNCLIERDNDFSGALNLLGTGREDQINASM
jgi:hypothetical protein